MARGALAVLGEQGARLVQADRANIWAAPRPALEVDFDRHEEALRAALAMAPGQARDDRLVAALSEDGTLLADEPYADWALAPRDRLEGLRQQARLALARDRAKGAGRSRLEAVVDAWESCLAHDPACEEAAAALVRAYQVQGSRQLVVGTYERCRAALEELGLRPSPVLEEVHAAAAFGPARAKPVAGLGLSPKGTPIPIVRDERRVVSVLFAEVAATDEDLEDLCDLVAEVLATVISSVEGLGGTVTSVSGASLQALFGAPEAHEDDPERAVRAALRSLQATARGPALRIGIESGPAIVGSVSSAAGSHYRAVGAVVGTAAALQSVARAGSVLVGPATRAATEALFEWDAEAVGLEKDGEALVGAYPEGPKPRAPSRQPRFGVRGRLVGRTHELSSLTDALKDAEAGRGSVVALVGEPGLGKTRLVQECRKQFMAWVGASSGRLPLWLEGRCASYASTTPYGLYQHLLASWAGVAPDQGEPVVGPALERALVAVMGNRDLWPLLARMMDLPSDATAQIGPYDLQRATFSALRAIIARLARAGPTVLALEDLHWADATSLRLTEEIAPLALEGPLLLLVTRRLSPDPGVSALEEAVGAALGTKFRRLELGPLSEDAEEELAADLVGAGATAPVIDAVRMGAEGNPLLLEERLFSMLETGRLARVGGEWRLAGAPGSELPQMLERLVRSRVDCLSPGAREMVRAASVIGVEFRLSLLAKASSAGEQLGTYLSEVCGAGLLHERPGASEPAYRFRHALIQEAVYGGLLRAERRHLHGRVGWTLESMSEDRLPEVGAVLGRHFAAAGEFERAVHHFESAGDRASAVYANDEAISSYRSALALLENDGRGDAVRGATNLHQKLAHVLWRRGRHDEIREALQRALAACGDDTLQGARILMRIGRNDLGFNRTEAAAEAFDGVGKLLDAYVAHRDQEWTEVWLELMVEGRALLYVVRHDPERAFAALTAARPLLDSGGPSLRRTFYKLMTVQRVIANRWRVDDQDLANLQLAIAAAAEEADEREIGWLGVQISCLLLCHDDLAGAQEELERSLAIGERHGDLGLQAWSLSRLSTTALRRQDVEAVRALAPEAVAACGQYVHPELVVGAKACLAWLAWQEQRCDDVLSLAAEVDELYATFRGWDEPSSATAAFWGTLEFKWVFLWPVLAVHLRTGNVAGAVAAGRQMLDPSQQRLPEDLEFLLESACHVWEQRDARAARVELRRALGLAHKLHYF